VKPDRAFRLATFSVEVTCPVGHPLIAGLRAPAKEIIDPLYAKGFVLLGAGEPIVLCAIDWCEIRNQSYERWRDELAKAAGTKRDRVLVCCLHQHDAPVTDIGAGELLASVGLGGKMFRVKFEERCIQRVAAAVRKSLKDARRVTHIGTGQAKVEKVASNRRVVLPNGQVTYGRGSSSGGNKQFRDAPDGLIDPWLKTLSFWDGDTPVLALHAYATHPMSYYGGGGVSADFVGMARSRMQREHPNVPQIYVSGCSGDVTAGKYNDGAPANRPILAERLFAAMKEAWKNTRKQPIERIDFRSTKLDLEFRKTAKYTKDAMTAVLKDPKATMNNRILAAMGLSSRQRVEAGRTIDFPLIDFGKAQVVLFPGEAFVGYQLQAQKLRPSSFVVCVGYGECWPGYIPTTQGFADNFDDIWYWVAPGSDRRMEEAIRRVAGKKP
jgi:hypothetical protein